MILRPSLGSRKRYRDRVPGEEVAAIVVHTTGSGPLKRFKRDGLKRGWRSPFDAALHLYCELMAEGPHYVIGEHGELAQVAREEQVAWHVGANGGASYARESWASKYPWWAVRFPGLRSPRELASGRLWLPPLGGSWGSRWLARAGSPNARTIGVEVVPPAAGGRLAWSAATWATLAELVRGVTARHAVPRDRMHIITHSDAHPIARTTSSGVPWDPPPSQWTWAQMCAEISRIERAPLRLR